MPKITIYVPDKDPFKIGFDDQIEVNVGRADDNDIVIDHDSISSHHAQLKLHGDQYHLVDLDSTNGTFVDGGEASNVPLHDGVKITFGTVEAEYEATEEEAAGEEEAEFDTESEGSGFENTIHAEIAAESAAPASFKNLSPIEKPEKKDVFSQIAMVACIVALATAAAVVAFGAIMKID
jgi:pSer/pThr/pTyr-binding forkhead associated (FHA) protein